MKLAISSDESDQIGVGSAWNETKKYMEGRFINGSF